jgi:putative methionine-R-sulfoxide reductase with GAF domain
VNCQQLNLCIGTAAPKRSPIATAGGVERRHDGRIAVDERNRRAMNVILQGDGSPFGVLEVDSKSEGEFGDHDIAFLQGAAIRLSAASHRPVPSEELAAMSAPRANLRRFVTKIES